MLEIDEKFVTCINESSILISGNFDLSTIVESLNSDEKALADLEHNSKIFSHKFKIGSKIKIKNTHYYVTKVEKGFNENLDIFFLLSVSNLH